MSTQSLVLQKIGRDNAGNYTCLASNDRGETTSPVVTLRVQCKFKTTNDYLAIIGSPFFNYFLSLFAIFCFSRASVQSERSVHHRSIVGRVGEGPMRGGRRSQRS